MKEFKIERLSLEEYKELYKDQDKDILLERCWNLSNNLCEISEAIHTLLKYGR